MDQIFLENFRCFHGAQTARLAPLTLLVGDNSTGKTSFLAIIRALWDTFHMRQEPNFKDAPYDLGNFPELVHHRGGRSAPAGFFSAGFTSTIPQLNSSYDSRMEFRMRIRGSHTIPVLHSRSLSDDAGAKVIEFLGGRASRSFRLTTANGSWDVKKPEMMGKGFDLPFSTSAKDLYHMLAWEQGKSLRSGFEYRPVGDAPQVTRGDKEAIQEMLRQSHTMTGDRDTRGRSSRANRPFASAPARSKPRRIYSPTNLEQDVEGDYIPMYLADMYIRYPERWNRLKEQLERFGSDAGLFDEIGIKLLGDKGGAGFLVQVRKFSGLKTRTLKGPQRNLTDVGYGISQVLSVVTELLRKDSSAMFLLQQPEAHLHPRAQAALGSLFCRVVSSKKHQLVVETHSDYLVDRMRMLIRHRETKLKPEDVSILFFERQSPGVVIHSLRLDEQGSIQDAPEGYRRFFMEEFDRLFGVKGGYDFCRESSARLPPQGADV